MPGDGIGTSPVITVLVGAIGKSTFSAEHCSARGGRLTVVVDGNLVKLVGHTDTLAAGWVTELMSGWT